MEYYNNALCVSFEELTTGDPPIMAVGTLKSLQYRRKVVIGRRGCGEGRHALYIYDSLPTKYKEKWVAKYGSPAEMERRRLLEARLIEDKAAKEFFHSYERDGKGLPQESQEEYIRNATILTSLLHAKRQAETLHRALNNPRRNMWAEMLQLSEALREIYPHSLPASLSRFKDKVRAFQTEGYESLVSKKLGNSNTQKITPEGQEFLLAMKRSQTPRYSLAEMFEEYNLRAEEKGWKPIKTQATLRNFFEKPEIKQLWTDAVMGELKSKELFARKHRTEMPTVRDTLWYGDGTKINLYYRDSKGNVRTTSVYEVMDAATEVLLGYCIGDGENFSMQYHAYRMAIGRSGHKPYEIVVDNQGGHRSKEATEFFPKICHLFRFTQPHNAASKTIESAFGRFQRQHLHALENFTGQNITAKRDDSRLNDEWHYANQGDTLPTLEQLHAKYARLREEWNETPHPATGRPRIEMYEQSFNPHAEPITDYDLVNMFWVFTQKPTTFTASGIVLHIPSEGEGKPALDLPYEVFTANGQPDHAWRRRWTLYKFYIAYDPLDLSQVRLYEETPTGDKRFITMAKPYRKIHRATLDQTEDEAKFIRQEQEAAKRDRIERVATGRALELLHGTAPEQHGYRSPVPKAIGKEGEEELERLVEEKTKGREVPARGRVKAKRAAVAKSSLGQRTKRISYQDWLEVTETHEATTPSPQVPLTSTELRRRVVGNY